MNSKSDIVHFATLNVQGLRDSQKRSRFLQWINQQRINILMIQETHFTTDIVSKVNLEFEKFNLYHSLGSNHSRGCSVIISKYFF